VRLYFVAILNPWDFGAIFLVIEARAQQETGTSTLLPATPHREPPYSEKARDQYWWILYH